MSTDTFLAGAVPQTPLGEIRPPSWGKGQESRVDGQERGGNDFLSQQSTKICLTFCFLCLNGLFKSYCDRSE